MSKREKPDWVTQGKSIQRLIEELQSFENQELEVRISVDAGDSHAPISLVKKQSGCVLTSYVDFYDKKLE